MPDPAPVTVATTLPLDEWHEAGESRAVAAVAHRALRSALLGQLPGIPAGVVDSRLMRIVEERRPQWPAAELATVLRALEVAQFSDAGQGESLTLAARAEELRGRIVAGAGAEK